MQHVTTYQRITRALTVLDVAEPISFKFDKSTPISDVASELGEDLYNFIVLIESNGRPYGIVESGKIRNSEQTATLESVAKKINSHEIVPSNLSLYDLMPLWKNGSIYTYFILDGTSITHFVSRHHMDSAPVKTALFAMTAEFEGLILNLLMNDLTKVKERFERVPDNDHEKTKKFTSMQKRVKSLAKKKGLPDNSIAYIQCTYLSDKVDILLLDAELCKFAFPDADHAILENDLTFVSKFRNEIAHGGSIFNVVQNVAHLNEIVDQLEDTIIDLRGKLNITRK